jgi:hypothetical protein
MKKIFFSLLTIILGTSFGFSALAAELQISTISTGEISVMIDSGGEAVNAYEGQVNIPSEIEVTGIDTGSSIVSMWVTRPVTSNNITFSGITVGSFTSRGELFRVKIKAKSGSYPITFANTRVLLANGSGTPATLKTTPLTLQIPKGGTEANKKQIDTTSPEPFSPIVIQDKSQFDGHRAIVFSTTDQGSGIAYYEVQEGNTTYRAESPYILRSQWFPTNITIRAIDAEGNVREEKIFVHAPTIIYVGLLLCGIIAIIIFAFFRHVLPSNKKHH